MNPNQKSPRVLTEGFFKTRARRPVIWEVKRIEVPAEGGPGLVKNAFTPREVSDSEINSESDFVWRVAA